MSSIGYLTTEIPANGEFSGIITQEWYSKLQMVYIATTDILVNSPKLELYIQTKLNPEVWLPLRDLDKKVNSHIELVQNSIIPCTPYVGYRGAQAIKFKLTVPQTNKITLEIGFI
jgi:hypothetical protein